MKNIVLVFLVICLFSCSNQNKKPDYVIPHEDMVNLIIDMHVADGMLTINKLRRSLAKNDSLNYYDAIFDSYGYNRTDFDTSIYFYSSKIAEYDKIYEEVLNRLSEIETELKEKSASEAKGKEEKESLKENMEEM